MAIFLSVERTNKYKLYPRGSNYVRQNTPNLKISILNIKIKTLPYPKYFQQRQQVLLPLASHL